MPVSLSACSLSMVGCMNMSFLSLNQEFLLRARFHIVRAAVEVFRAPDVVVFHRRPLRDFFFQRMPVDFVLQHEPHAGIEMNAEAASPAWQPPPAAPV